MLLATEMKTKKRITNKKRSKKVGLVPGTISYVGDVPNFEVSASTFTYNANSYNENKKVALEEIGHQFFGEDVRWINFNGIHDEKVLEFIGQTFSIHNLVMEDIAHTVQRPKLDEFKDYQYIAVQMITYDSVLHQVEFEQLSIIVKAKTLISFQEREGDVFEAVRERIRNNSGKIRKSSTDYLLYALLDTIVDHYFVVIEKLGDELDRIEVRILNGANDIEINELHSIKRELILLRKAIWPMRELISSISKSALVLNNENTELYFRDVYDHCIRAIDTLETYREISSGLLDMYLSTLSNKMNTVMKTLTIISTIFIPLTFIVGVYGMNFKYMPEIEMPHAYAYVWGVMISLGIIMIIYFRKKGWF